MEPKGCKKEVQTKEGKLKAAIADCLSADGAYLFFCSQECNKKMIKERIKKIREGIAESGDAPYPEAVIDFYDANRIADWTNAHSPVAVWVLEQTTGVRLTRFRTWDNWALDEDLADLRFVTADDLSERIRQLRTYLGEHRAVARVVGLSGLGKTRLAFEAFRPSSSREDAVQDALSATLLYASTDIDASAVIEQVQVLCDDGVEALLVLDDCASDIHAKLRKIVRRLDSRLSLLTLDYDPAGAESEDHLINMPRSSDAVIKGILGQACPQLSDSDVSRVIDFAQGFPQVAVLIGRARLQNAPDLGSLTDSDLVDKMLGGRRGAGDQAREVVRACAMFDVLGIEGAFKAQMQFAAEHLCRIDHREFYAIVQDFVERGLIQKRGDFVQVQPKPLAIRLASEKWKRIPPDEALALFEEKMPPGRGCPVRC
jgi:hypothetical protein